MWKFLFKSSQMLLNNLIKGFPEAGCDEAGRGCLAGPVFSAAVILPEDFRSELLNDSKKLSEKQRSHLRILIERESICWAVASCDNLEIDRINILNCSILAMHRALDQLSVRPAHIIVDGNRFKLYENIPHTTVIKGDGKYLSIAAASVLAKTYRDDFMKVIHEKYPHYDWNQNKGYPTAFHRRAIINYGITPFHRRSFKLTEPQRMIDF